MSITDFLQKNGFVPQKKQKEEEEEKKIPTLNFILQNVEKVKQQQIEKQAAIESSPGVQFDPGLQSKMVDNRLVPKFKDTELSSVGSRPIDKLMKISPEAQQVVDDSFAEYARKATEFSEDPTVWGALGTLPATLGLLFTPISAAFKEAEQVPVLGLAPQGVSYLLEKKNEVIHGILGKVKENTPSLAPVIDNFLEPSFAMATDYGVFKGLELTYGIGKVVGNKIRYKEMEFTIPELELVKTKVGSGETLSVKEQVMSEYVKYANEKLGVNPDALIETMKKSGKDPSVKVGVKKSYLKELKSKTANMWKEMTGVELPEVYDLALSDPVIAPQINSQITQAFSLFKESRLAGYDKGITPEGRPGIEKPTALPDPLTIEARKYKSAEEFVEGKIDTEDVVTPKWLKKNGSEINLHQAQKVFYMEGDDVRVVPINTLIVEAGGLVPDAIGEPIKTLSQFEGYASADSFFVYKASDLKSQLTDIWNKAKLPTETLPGKFANLEGPEGKLEARLREKGRKVAEKTVELEVIDERLKGFVREDLNAIRKLSRSLEKTEGDVETLRKESPEFVNTTLEMVSEKLKVDESKALEFVKDVPTRGQIRELKKARRLTATEANKLKRRIERLQPIRNRIEKQKAQQKVKADIIQYAKDIPLRERGKLLATIKNAKTQKDLNNAVDRIGELQEFSEKKDLRTKIGKALKKYAAKKKDKGKTSVKFELIRNGYKEILNNTQKENVKLESDLADRLEGVDEKNPIIAQDLVTYAILTENNKGLKDMDSKELKTILSRIEEKQGAGRNSFLLDQVNRAMKITSDIEDSVENMMSAKAGGESATLVNRKKNGLVNLMNTMDVFDRGYAQIMSMLDSVRGGKFFRKVLYRPIQKANEVFFEMEAKYTDKDQKKFREIFSLDEKKVPFKGFLTDKATRKFTKQKYIGALNMWLSQGEMVDLYLSSTMNQNRKALMENGMYVGGKNPKTRVIKFTPGMLSVLESKMSPEAKKMADYILEQVQDPDFTQEMVDAYEAKYNKPFPFVDDGYWPMNRRYMGTKEKGVDLLSPDQEYKTVLSPKAFKQRIENSNPLLIRDAFTKFFNWRNDIARFVSYDKSFTDISSVINSKDFKSEFIEQFGSSSYRQLVDGFNFTVNNGQAYSDAFAKGVNYIKQVMSVSFIGGKIRNVLSQGSSALAGFAEVPVKDFNAGLAKAILNPKKAYEKMSESPLIKYRHKKAGFSKGMMEQETTAYKKQGVDVAELAMYFTRVGDMTGVVGAGYAVYDAKLKEYGKNYSSSEADRMALDDAVEFVLSTQQSALPEYSNWIKRAHPLIRTAGAFQQAQSMYRAKYFDSVREWGNDPNKWSKESMTDLTKNVIAYQFVLPGMYEVSRGNWNPASLAAKTIFSPISGFMGVGKVVEYGIMYVFIIALLPLLGGDEDDYGHLMPFSPSSLTGEALLMFEKTVESMGDVITDESNQTDILNIIDGAAAVLKIPSKNLREEYMKSKDVFTGDNRTFKRLLQTEWQSKQDNPILQYKDDLESKKQDLEKGRITQEQYNKSNQYISDQIQEAKDKIALIKKEKPKDVNGYLKKLQDDKVLTGKQVLLIKSKL